MFPRLRCGDGQLGMCVGRRGDHNRIYVGARQDFLPIVACLAYSYRRGHCGGPFFVDVAAEDELDVFGAGCRKGVMRALEPATNHRQAEIGADGSYP